MPEQPGVRFTELFGAPPETRADAPGRVNLIGEHTDYHDGFVLPFVLPQRTRIQLRRRPDRVVRAASAAADDEHVVEFSLGAEQTGRGWADYVQGVTFALAARGMGLPQGFDLWVDSNVPVGAGVSSSAALTVSLLRALRIAFGLSLDDVGIALTAQKAETDFVGAPVGVMDQMACSLGGEHEALFLDTRTLAFERIPLPDSAELVVIDSGITHAHAGGEYATRRRESFEAAARLGVDRLRDVNTSSMARISALPPILARRARHIVTENERVVEAAAALRTGDMAGLGALFNASHASMRDDYQTSVEDIDTLVAIAAADADIYGARMTGGGFGGAVVMLARAGTEDPVARRVLAAYQQRTGRTGRVLLPTSP